MNITYPINALPRAIPLCLGVQSEYGARPISIDVSEWVGRWPDVIVSVQPVRPGEDVSYPAAGVTRSGNIVTWTPNSYDTEIPGTGSVEIIGLADGVKIIRTGAATSIAPTQSSVSKTPEDPIAAWADSVIRAGEQAKAGAEEALLLAQAANKSANNANASAVQAQSAQRAAANAASQAATYLTDAVGAMNAAKNSQTQAKTSEQSASASATAAYKSQTKAEAAAKRAEDAANSMGGGGTVSPGDGKLKADAIICEQSGDIITSTDAAAEQAVSLVSHIEPAQEGTGDPSPDNVRPITGWNTVSLTRTGKNIFGGMALARTIADKVNGATLNEDAKTVTYDAPAMRNVNVFDGFEPGKRYTFIFTRDESKSSGTTANMRIVYESGDPTNISFVNGNPVIVTSRAGSNVARLAGYYSSGPTCLLYEQCGIFEGVLTAEDFAPYEGQPLTAELPETVYGGTLDWTTGLLTVTPYVFMESPVPTGAGVREASNGAKYITVDHTGYAKCSDSAKVLCSHYRTVTGVGTSGAIRYVNGQFFVYDDSATADNYTTLLEGVQILYPAVGDAKTVQLTPQQLTMLKGTNNVWSSTGDTDVQYVADTKAYVDGHGGKFELLNTITMTAGEKAVTVKTDQDGAPLRLKAAMVKVTTQPLSAAVNGYVNFYHDKQPDNISGCYVSGMTNTTQRTSTSLSTLLYGRWFAFSLGDANSTGNNATVMNYTVLNGKYGADDYPYMTKVYISQTEPFATGSTIEIWGVRADA